MAICRITDHREIAPGVYDLRVAGDMRAFTTPGQFAMITAPGYYLRRPISACDFDGETARFVYRVVGGGTAALADLTVGAQIDLLPGLGNGFSMDPAKRAPLLIGGGLGVPPLYALAKALLRAGQTPRVALGFERACMAILAEEFVALGCETAIATVDGSRGARGFVTDVLPEGDCFYACGPVPMLKAVSALDLPGQVSLEARMGCGFGACMGCTIKTANGDQRVCKDGPVFDKEAILW